MESKIFAIVNWGVLVIVTLVAVFMVWGFPSGEVPEDDDPYLISDSCVDIEKLEGLEYKACYDPYSEMIFLKASRAKENYNIKNIEVSFVDLASQSYVLDEVPAAGKTGAYKLLANKNPKSVSIKLNVVKDFAGSVCSGSGVFVDFCPAGTGGVGGGVNVLISPIDGVEITDFVEVVDFSEFDSDIVFIDLVDKEKIWESTCKSNWDCGQWEACENGIQRRECKDLNNCAVSTNSPVSTQRCDGACVENWECSWSGCEGGYSTPSCRDKNNCGTSYGVPKKLSCRGDKCVPNVVCSEWSECVVDYNFIDLVGKEKVTQISGEKSRICVDKAGCGESFREEEGCSMSVDIYTKRFERCGEEYVGVYDVLDDSILAILKEGTETRASLNIYFDDQNGIYCDYCFDGIINGDEEGVDCGGSCKSCKDPVRVEGSWWDFLF
jgi:hypothetical protein